MRGDVGGGWDVVVMVVVVVGGGEGDMSCFQAGRHSNTPCSPSHKMAALNALNICMEEMESTSKK